MPLHWKMAIPIHFMEVWSMTVTLLEMVILQVNIR